MRRIFSERNVVVILFLIALVVFIFAQEDTRKVEKMYMSEGENISVLAPARSQSATVEIPAAENTVTPAGVAP